MTCFFFSFGMDIKTTELLDFQGLTQAPFRVDVKVLIILVKSGSVKRKLGYFKGFAALGGPSGCPA